ncbi:MAG: hypothetical protein SCH98_07890 [Deferrisomatales bacterium]|nr:hypothetical protein [Deferrisomatales bacterium]
METIRGFYGIPVTAVESLELFSRFFESFRGRSDVIAVAPDLVAARRVAAFGRALGLPSAVASKHWPHPETAAIEELIGDFSGKRIALVMDDMIGTGGTVHAVAEAPVEEKGIEEIHVGVSHYLGLPKARERLDRLHDRGILSQLVVTNSIPSTEELGGAPYVHSLDIAGPLARAILDIHHDPRPSARRR